MEPGVRRGARVGVFAVACALAVAAVGCGGGAAAREPAGSRTAFTLMQANLCLSGLAGCFGRVAYPAGVRDAVAWVRAERPDAVTLSEACSGDVERIAADTGYHARFARVVYAGERLPCVRPGGRGLFGIAVLTAAPAVRSEGRAFAAQSGPERRRWLCVTTRDRVDVCTAHLNTRSAVERAGNDGQCPELAAILAARGRARAVARAVVFGGDVNRRSSCAPRGAWVRTDARARQSGGLQHVYGSGALRDPVARVLPAPHTDHDVLLVRARP